MSKQTIAARTDTAIPPGTTGTVTGIDDGLKRTVKNTLSLPTIPAGKYVLCQRNDGQWEITMAEG